MNTKERKERKSIKNIHEIHLPEDRKTLIKLRKEICDPELNLTCDDLMPTNNEFVGDFAIRYYACLLYKQRFKVQQRKKK